MQKSVLSLLCLLWSASEPTAQAQNPPPEPQSIFDGHSFADWDHQDSHWSIEDNAITGTIPDGQQLNRNLFIFYKGEVHDFELELDVKVTGHPSANSGVQFRCVKTDHGAAGYQADIDDGALWLGRIYDEHGRALIAERGAQTTIGPLGNRATVQRHDPKWVDSLVTKNDWIHYTVRAVGPRIETYVNGQRTNVLIDNEIGQQDFSGSLALQLHSGPGPAKIQFKNLTLTHLGQTPLPESKPAPSLQPEGRPGIEPPAALNLGFELGSLEGWTATGTAWDDMPVQGDTVTPRRPGQASDHVGDYWVGGYERTHSDAAQGTLTSQPFEVTHPHASFLVGGGHQRETRVDIVLAESGKVIHTASGPMNENLVPSAVDLTAHLGKTIQIKIIDESSAPWGHLNYDDFRFHDELPARLVADSAASRVRTNPILQHLVKNPAAPEPSTPALANVANTYLPEGFEAHLIAAEPDVRQPIAITTDERGRLWVAEAFSYPQRQPEGEGKDRILIFADEDGDGSYETRKVFTENLNLVSGLEVGFGGVWVGAAPHLLFIPDKNRDDIPDAEPHILLDGFGYQDTHETLNSFIWGPDGWLYGNQGVFNTSHVGKPGTPPNERTTLRAGVWRYHPVRHEFDIFAHGGSNQWGLDFDKHGEAFITHCRSYWGGGPTTHVVLNGHYWNQSNANHAPFVSASAPPELPHLQNFLRASAKYGHGEGGAGKPGSRALYGGHSHVGTMIYQGTNWPAEYRDGLFTHNLHGHQINHQRNRPLGSGYETVHAGQDLAFVDAPDYVAVDLITNHDGAVYVIDWADKQHCHSPHMERWERSDGRIYRIAYAPTYQTTKVDFSKLTDAQLVAEVTSENEWSSRTARRLLQERAAGRKIDPGAIGSLGNLEGNAPAQVLRKLWTLHITGQLDPALVSHSLLLHPLVQPWAVRLTTGNGTAFTMPRPTPHRPATHPREISPAVNLAIASAIADAPAREALGLASILAARAEDNNDPNLPNMIFYAIAPHLADNLDAAFDLAEKTAMPKLRDQILCYLAKDPTARNRLVAMLGTVDVPTLQRQLTTLRFALGETPSPMPEAWPAVSGRLYAHPDGKIQADARHLGALFSDDHILADLRATLANTELREQVRRRAFHPLATLADRPSLPTFLTLLDDPDFRPLIIPVLARYDDPAIAPALIHAFTALPPNEQATTINTLTARATNAVPFLQAIATGKIDKKTLTAVQVRQLRTLGDPAVTKLATDLFGTVRETAADKNAIIAKIRKAYTEAPLWAYSAGSGKTVFDQVCASCHAVNGQGGNIGPDLAGSGNNGLDYFLEGIVDPNAVVGTDFQLSIITKHDNSVLAGSVREETKTHLTLQTLTDQQQIPVSEIKSRQQLESSLMPEGLLSALSQRQQIELLKYLTSLR